MRPKESMALDFDDIVKSQGFRNDLMSFAPVSTSPQAASSVPLQPTNAAPVVALDTRSFPTPAAYQVNPRTLFQSLGDARLFWRANGYWKPDCLDEDLPQTDSAKLPYVEALVTAMLDFSDVHDNRTLRSGRYMNAVLGGRVTPHEMYAAAVSVVDAAVRLHESGKSCNGSMDPTVDSYNVIHEDERNMTFLERMQQIGQLFKTNKKTVWDVTKQESSLEYLCVLAPKTRLSAKARDTLSNNRRAAALAEAKRIRANVDKEAEDEGADCGSIKDKMVPKIKTEDEDDAAPSPKRQKTRTSRKPRTSQEHSLGDVGESESKKKSVPEDVQTVSSPSSGRPTRSRKSRISINALSTAETSTTVAIPTQFPAFTYTPATTYTPPQMVPDERVARDDGLQTETLKAIVEEMKNGSAPKASPLNTQDVLIDGAVFLDPNDDQVTQQWSYGDAEFLTSWPDTAGGQRKEFLCLGFVRSPPVTSDCQDRT